MVDSRPVRRFRLSVVGFAGLLLLAIALNASPAVANGQVSLRPAISAGEATGGVNPALTSPHRPRADAARTQGATARPCDLALRLQQRSARPYSFRGSCAGIPRNPDLIRPSPAANRSAEEIRRALLVARCSS